MYLKSIEIQGFKSFAKKTKITFNESITAVVGPNGSGKSNILDAISWTLGEQRVKSLRGNKMSDVIFSGTDTRKAQGLADVTMTFDNSSRWLPLPYEEVSVQRRMYRSGESEFRINKDLCRLKDIQELFMDTGIGKDGYSFIGQGQIDAVLSNKPGDRRMIFEEAAGISKFKKRKLESMKKLDGVLDDLDRIQDLLSELYSQEEALKEESDRYLNYQKVYEEKKRLDHQVYALATRDNREKLKALSLNIPNLRKELEEKREGLAQEREALNTKEMDLDQLERDLEAASNLLQVDLETWFKEEKGQLEIKNQVERMEERLQGAREENARLKEEKEDLARDKTENLEKISQESQKIQEKKDQIREKTRSIDGLKEEFTQRERALSSLGQRVQENKQDQAQLLLRIDTQRQMLKEKIQRRDKYQALLDQARKELADLEKKKSQESQLVKELEEKNQVFLSQHREKKQDLMDLEARVSALKSQVEENELRYNQEKNQRNFLQSTLDHYNGFQKSVKSFLRVTDQEGLFQGEVLGPLANLFTVDKKYELAMSLALGFALQNVVVQSDSQVKEMIEVLKKRDLGRVTFLPLNRYQGKKLSTTPPRGVLGYARDFIQCDDQFQGLFQSLLGNLVFVENYDQGLTLSKSLKSKIISLKGDVFHPKGSITGGSIQKGNVQILNQEKRLRDQEEKLDKINQLLEEERANFDQLKRAYDQLREEVEDQEIRIQGQNEDLYKRRQRIYALDQNQCLQERQVQGLEEDLKLSIEDCSQDEEKLAAYEGRKKDQEEESEGLQSYEEEKKALDQVKKALEEEKQDLQDLRLDLASLESQLLFSKERDQNLERDMETRTHRQEILDGEIIQLEKDRAEEEKRLTLYSKTYEEKGEDLDRRKVALNKKRTDLQASKDRLHEAKKAYEEELERDQDLQDQLQKKTFQKEKLELELSHSRDQLLERYGEIHEEDLVLEEDVKPGDLKKRLLSLKNQLLSFGPMNEKVLTDYQDVKARLDFKVQQKEDLIEAKEELNQVLDNLDRKMRQAFMKSFQEITGYFNDIFTQLFRGGQADISLEEGPILEAGIEIKAQPPGKKLQSLSLLSGGERSLTAVALIFALLKYRPAPFCILDEIDAALDDANIDRYVDYIQDLEDTQFIMITHRKPTMEIADILYGVTMEEKGISSIVPMQLTKTGQ